MQAFKLVLTNDVSPRDSQDDEIFPEHFKIKLKLNILILQTSILKRKEYEKFVDIIYLVQREEMQVYAISM